MTEPSGPIIQCQDVHKWFGKFEALRGISMEVEQGEVIVIFGPSGSGKSTFIRTLNRLEEHQKGRIIIDGIELTKDVQNIEAVRMEIGMVFQQFNLFPHLTVLENITLAPEQVRKKSKSQAKEIGMQLLDRVGIPEQAEKYPHQLSGGMRQRVCIAMALSTEPELLLADEPTTSLDVTIQDQVLRLLNELVERHGTSVIFITHSLGVVREMADRVYVMYAGNIIEGARKEELFANSLHPYTVGLMNALPKLTGGGIAEGIPGRIPEYLDPPSGCRFHPRCPRAMQQCSQSIPPVVHAADDHDVACFLYQGETDE